MLFKDSAFGLYTDFYELTMAQGYFYCGKKDQQASFEYFFRTNPYNGGFTVFAGLHDFIRLLSKFTFSASDIEYLQKQGLKSEFLDYLKDFRFRGNISSVNEGEIVFPNEPLVQVEGNIIECQLIESLLLNILNFESLIATKAFRIKLVSGGKKFTDFGLRRAQGFGSIHASRASVIGGASSTSNVLAGKLFNIPVSGTQAHSWVQSFDTELEAFRAYSKVHPENTILLVDTYNTLNSGIPNAITVAHEMEKQGHRLKAIRLDSGDLAYLSKKVRKMLDNAGLGYVKIVASNQLNETVISSLLKEQEAPIDIFGIGTEMIVGKPDAALDGVYKLTSINNIPKMKISENIEKITLPGRKQLFRFFDEYGNFYRDAILVHNEKIEETDTIYHPGYPDKNSSVKNLKSEPLNHLVVKNGEVLLHQKPLGEIHNYLLTRAELLPAEHKRFVSPHVYKVGISKKLMDTRNTLAEHLRSKK